jgi:HD-like signal output (HDOD) protein
VANSVALNPNGMRINELKTAIARIGFANVRTVSLAYAMDQIKNAPALLPIRKPLNELWERSVKVAAMAYVVARRWTKINADKALLAGLMHGMGRVYILTRAVKHPSLFSDAESYQQIVRDWNTSIAKAVLESWEISPDIVEAVEQYENIERETAGGADLTDVLTIANMLVSFHTDPVALELRLQETTASKRLGLTPDACQKVLQETAGELTSLRQALGA